MTASQARAWLREPLLHFLVLGASLFVVHGLVAQNETLDVRARIDVDAGVIDDLQRKWTAVWARPATDTELRRMIDEHVREDVLYREAMALDLDRDDTILRRRMIQKMRFLAEDVAQFAEPTEEEIATYFASNADRYRTPPRLSFAHAFFNPDTRGDALDEDIAAALTRLRGSDVAATDDEGDRFLAGYEFARVDERALAAQFGDGFARRVFELPPSEWHGPVFSGFGPHLVRVSSREPGSLPALEDVREQVVRDLREDRSAASNEELFAAMRAKYEVVIDEAALAHALSQAEDDE